MRLKIAHPHPSKLLNEKIVQLSYRFLKVVSVKCVLASGDNVIIVVFVLI